MKNLTLLIILFSAVMYSCQTQTAASEEQSVYRDGIRWSGKNEVANNLAIAGLNHYVNVELDKAYTLSEHAVQADSSLFASHTLLAFMSRGDKREYHKNMAKKFVAGENETSKLFVSLLDIKNDSTRAQRRAVWTKMHELSNGPFIHHMYARNLDIKSDTAAVIAELNKVAAFSEENRMNTMAAASYNLMGYMLRLKGDVEGGTKSIERSMKLYPDGHNPLDSRAEFYLFAGDTTNAILWYKKVLNKYPFSQSAQAQLELLAPEN